MRLQEHYTTHVIPTLTKQFAYRNRFEVPRLEKITLNVGVGRHTKDQAHIDTVIETIVAVTGQRPVVTKARKSIASFKVREGMPVGVTVTLRGARMWDFIEKLIHVTLPRVRDFRGLNEKSVDKMGNLSIGLREHIAFPEVPVDAIENIHGIEACITTSARTHEEGFALLSALGMPFQKKNT